MANREMVELSNGPASKAWVDNPQRYAGMLDSLGQLASTDRAASGRAGARSRLRQRAAHDRLCFVELRESSGSVTGQAGPTAAVRRSSFAESPGRRPGPESPGGSRPAVARGCEKGPSRRSG